MLGYVIGAAVMFSLTLFILPALAADELGKRVCSTQEIIKLGPAAGQLCYSDPTDRPAKPQGYPCSSCTEEDIRRLGIVLPPPKDRPYCQVYDDPAVQAMHLYLRRPSNCAP